ncbi:MAG: serine hydrolase domain-containing protein [Phycisphaerae bacterium]|nr:serine hydrolase domain-containing protein [Phycisphaerae bacterium]
MTIISHRLCSTVVATLMALACAACGSAAPPRLDDVTFAAIVEALEAKRIERHVPGMALAVVLRDGTTRVHCFGERDRDRHLPVEPETLFGLASTSKTFTAVLAASMAADGAMSFDDPVRKHLPWFRLHDPAVTEACTVRDLLCHRTGVNRTDILMLGPDLTRRELAEALANAEPMRPFRDAFQYNNQMYLVAGLVTAAASGHADDSGDAAWDALLTARLLAPLGMTRTTSSHATALADPQLSIGYRWDEKGTFRAVPTDGFELAAPAGGVFSTGADMARWLQLLLQRGTVDGQQIVPAALIDELWTQQIEMSPGRGYGLGFMTGSWRGRRLVHHGGNLDGFSPQLAILPDEGAGFVLLTNNFASLLTEEAIEIVFNGLTKPAGDAPVAKELADLVGCYTFGPTGDTWSVVHLGDGTLGLDVPRQQIYTLAAPDADGMRTLVELPVAKLRFDRIPEGPVQQIAFVQAEQTFILPRLTKAECDSAMAKQAAKPPGEPIPVAKLEPYIGTYWFERAAQTWEVLISERGRLAVDVPGQITYELHWPDADGKWVFELTDAISVSFVVRTAWTADQMEETYVDTLTVHQSGRSIDMPRAVPPADLPTIETVLALVRKANPPDAAHRIKALHGKGTVRFPHQGVSGTFDVHAVGMTHQVRRLDFGRFGFAASAVTDDSGWQATSKGPAQPLASDEVDELKRQHPLAELQDWSTRYPSMRVTETRTIDGVETIAVRVRGAHGRARVKFVDRATGDIVREEGAMPVGGGLLMVPYVVTSSDFRAIEGMRMPFRVTNDNAASGRSEIVIESIEVNGPVPAGVFEPPAINKTVD